MRYIIGFIILSWVIYIPSFYLFFDNAKDTVEDITLEHLWPMYSMSPNDTEMIEKQLSYLEDQDVKIDSSLKSVLKDWDVENLKLSSKNSELPGLKLINYSFNLGEFKVIYHAKAIEKSLLRLDDPGPSAQFIMIDAIECRNGENSRVISHEDDLRMFLMATYAKPKTKGLPDALKHFCPLTGVKAKQAENPIKEIEVETEVQITPPSFNCSAASNLVEQSICNNNDLANLDNQLNEAYNTYNQYLGDSNLATELDTSQKKWLIERNKCEDSDCIGQSYKIRISELDGLLNSYLNGNSQ